MISDWIETTLEEIAFNIQYGHTASASKIPIGPKFLRITDIKEGKVDWDNVPFCNCENKEKYLLKKGDILFARTGSTGKSFLIRDCPESVFASYLIRLQLTSKALPEYIYQYFQTNSYWSQIHKFTTGSIQGGLNASKLAKIKIPLPPLPIQKKIAEVLERADAAREKRRQANALTEQFLQSVFLEMFGDPAQNPKKWKTLTILEVISKQKHSIVRGPFGGAIKKEIFVPDGYKVYEQKNAIKNDFEIGTYYIDEEKYKLMQSFAIVPNDLIISCSGTIGKVAIVPKDAKPGIINQALMKISLDESKALPIFMKYLLETDHLQRLFFGSAEGSAIKNVKPLKEIKQKCFPLSPLKEQIKFSELVQKIDILRRKQNESENELEKLFQSLMQKAFKGELVFKEKLKSAKEKVLSPTDRHAGILGLIITAHQEKDNYWITLGERKGEKLSHLIEDRIEEELGRKPKRDAAGPDDYPHLQKVHHRANMQKWYSVHKRPGGKGKSYRPEKNLKYLIKDIKNDIGEKQNEVERIIKLFLDKKTEFAEIAVTVYAAWNDLIIDRKKPTDEEIVYEARENWSEEKLKIEREKFVNAIKWLRENDLVPIGKGKKTIQ